MSAEREQESDCGRKYLLERQDRVRRAASKQRPRPRLGEQAAREAHGRTNAVEAEARHRDRVVGNVQRAEQVSDQRPPHAHEAVHQPSVGARVGAQPRGRVRHRTRQRHARPVVERMRH